MNILVLGAYGFIGSAVVARLNAEGHRIIGLGRAVRNAQRRRPDICWIRQDLRQVISADAWVPLLQDIDAIVNCIGVLQDGPSDNVRIVQTDSIIAMFEAAERCQVRRVIHISAVGVDKTQLSAFTATKLMADQNLADRDLDWIILRPSVVYGRNAYGGSALLRAAASLPWILPDFANGGKIQLVHLDDVSKTVAFFLENNNHSKITLELVGSEPLTLREILMRFRQWFGLREPWILRIPQPFASVAFRLGDLAGALGWRPPLRTTAQKELTRGAEGNAKSCTNERKKILYACMRQ